MTPFHQYVEQIQGLSLYQQGLIAQVLEKETGAKISDEDLKNPHSPRYKAAMTVLTLFVTKMIMLDQIAVENNKQRSSTKEDRKANVQPYYDTPETRTSTENNTQSTILIDTAKLEALLRELEKDMVDLNIAQNNVNNLNQQIQTLQNNLNQVNQQIQVAQTQQNIQPQVVPQPQHIIPTAPQTVRQRPVVHPTSHRPVHVAPIIPQHSQVMTKTSNPGMVQPYPVEVVRKRKTELEHQAKRVINEFNNENQKIQKIIERMELRYELMKNLCPSMEYKAFNFIIHNVHFQNMLANRLNNPDIFDSRSFSMSMPGSFGSSS